MQVFLLHGQSHRGTTYHMGRILAEKLTDPGSIREFFLPGHLNHFCRGCYACIEDEEKCPFWDEKKKILEAMEASDILIFTTPNYCGAPSGAMKSFVDLFFDLWMVHRPKPWMFHKKAAVLSASAGSSCRKAIGIVKNALTWWGIPCVKTYGLSVQAMSWEQVKPEIKDKIEKKLTGMTKALKKGCSPFAGFRMKMIFGFMRGLHKKGWDSSPTESRYWKDQGWLDKKRPWRQ